MKRLLLLLLSASVAAAQWTDGPFIVVGPTVRSLTTPSDGDPAAQPNRVIHVIGDDLVGTDGTNVALWPAASGTSALATGPAGNRPTMWANVANGHKVARFTTSQINFSDVLSGLTQATAYVVVKLAADPPATEQGLWDVSPGTDDMYYVHSTLHYIFDGFGSSVRHAAFDPPNMAAEFRVYAVSSKTNQWEPYIDGTQVYSDVVASAVTFNTTPKLGFTAASTRRLTGDVAEFVVFSSAHDSTKVGQISAFLKNKYVPPPIDPGSQVGRVIHLQGDDLTGADGAPIASWPAAAGTSNAATGPIGSRPIKKVNIAKGHTVARFGSSGQEWVTFADVLSGLTQGTVYIVFKADADPPPSDVVGGGLWQLGSGGAGNAPYFTYSADGKVYDDCGSATRASALAMPNLATEFRVYAVTSAPGAWTNYMDGIQKLARVTNTVGFSSTPGLGLTVAPSHTFKGDIAEFVVFSTAHTQERVGQISKFLKAKYQ